MKFAHLQVSTAYSLLSSTVSIPALIQRAKELNYSALAITDHNVLYGVLPFYKACLKAKIKPIIGLTIDIYFDEETSSSLVLLAKNNQGYKNLIMISTLINTNGKKLIDWNQMLQYQSDLIALTPGRHGAIEQFAMTGQIERAFQLAKQFKEAFEEFYITLQTDGTATQRTLNETLQNMGNDLSIPIVATNDVQYIQKEDAFAHQCLLAIKDGIKMSDDIYLGADEQQHYYLKSEEEMVTLFQEWPEAIDNTSKIVNQCNVMIETNLELLPKFPLGQGETATNMLEKLCLAGMKARIPSITDQYKERLKFELSVIGKMGFNDYFLIVWDFMKYAREQNILTGPGRGSAAGSLVAYCLGITDIDPIEHGLLFERFLNPERVSMPDIDIDFPDHRRDEVIQYVVNKYGRDNVAQIVTFGTFAAKAAARDIARVFGFNTKELEQLSRLIPSRLGITLQQAYDESEGLRNYIQQSERYQKLFQTALKIEGLPRHTSTHAAGVVIAEEPLHTMVPLQGGESGVLLTQFPMEGLEEIGLLKMDFLGLRNLSLLERITKSIESKSGRTLRVKEIPLHDQNTLTLLQRGDTTGIFQLESDGMRRVLRDLHPTEFADIVAVNALFRPGPMDNIPTFIKRKHGREKVQYLHPDLQVILEPTYGVIVYQEQIMQIASTLAGFSLGEADLLRRAVSKKKKEILDQERKHFVVGAKENGYSEEVAHDVYNLIVRFANYGFNKSHAVAYSYISWQLAYLKANYPEEFMAALLTSAVGNEDRLAKYISELKQKNIKVLPPSINKSHFPFIVEREGIRYSLGAIKGIGIATLKELVETRKKKPFADLFDFCMRIPAKILNRKLLEALVHAGAMDEFGQDRAVLLASLDVAMEHAELMRPVEDTEDLFEDDELFNIKPKYIDAEPIRSIDKLAMEKNVLGLYLSDHPVKMYEEQFLQAGVIPLLECEINQRNIVAGVLLSSVKKIRTKKGDLMAFFTLSDESDEMDGVMFPDAFRRFGSICQEGDIVLIRGNIDKRGDQKQFIINHCIGASEVKIDEQTIYMKISDDQASNLTKLYEIMQKYHGRVPVIIHYEATKRTIKLAKKDWIQPSEECLNELKALIGEKNVILK